MEATLIKGIAAGFISFFALLMLLTVLFGPSFRRNGYRSSSIGCRGACSWHGGVDRSKGTLASFLSLIGALAIGVGAAKAFGDIPKEVSYIAVQTLSPEEPNRQNSAVLPVSPPPPSHTQVATPPSLDAYGVACPKCGSPMTSKMVRLGRHAGQPFFGCRRYPACDGIRELRRWRWTGCGRASAARWAIASPRPF